MKERGRSAALRASWLWDFWAHTLAATALTRVVAPKGLQCRQEKSCHGPNPNGQGGKQDKGVGVTKLCATNHATQGD